MANIQTFHENTDKDPNNRDACWIWRGSYQTGGYGQVRHNGKTMLAHRVAWMLFNNADDPTAWVIMHTCDNPKCVNPLHLKRCTHKKNMDDAIKKGRHLGRWPHHAVTKTRQRNLSNDDVRAIRASTEPLLILAARFNTSRANISLIRRGKRKKLVI